MEKKNYCFIHACNINNGLEILKELLDRIKDNSLDTVLEEIRVSILGPTSRNLIKNIENYNPKVKVIYTNINIKLYEYPTLKLIHNFCKEKPNCNVLYIHTKGASKPKLKAEISWRHYMSYFVIDKHRLCLNVLEKGYDNAGCELKVNGGKFKYLHYAGNFWWATSNYIRNKLPDPQIFVSQIEYFRESKIYRFHAEEWIMMSNDVKPYNIFAKNRNLIKNPIKYLEYKDGDNPYLNYLHVLRNSNIIDKQKYQDLLFQNNYNRFNPELENKDNSNKNVEISN